MDHGEHVADARPDLVAGGTVPTIVVGCAGDPSRFSVASAVEVLVSEVDRRVRDIDWVFATPGGRAGLLRRPWACRPLTPWVPVGEVDAWVVVGGSGVAGQATLDDAIATLALVAGLAVADTPIYWVGATVTGASDDQAKALVDARPTLSVVADLESLDVLQRLGLDGCGPLRLEGRVDRLLAPDALERRVAYLRALGWSLDLADVANLPAGATFEDHLAALAAAAPASSHPRVHAEVKGDRRVGAIEVDDDSPCDAFLDHLSEHLSRASRASVRDRAQEAVEIALRQELQAQRIRLEDERSAIAIALQAADDRLVAARLDAEHERSALVARLDELEAERVTERVAFDELRRIALELRTQLEVEIERGLVDSTRIDQLAAELSATTADLAALRGTRTVRTSSLVLRAARSLRHRGLIGSFRRARG